MPDLGGVHAFDDIKTAAHLPAWPMGAGGRSPAETHGPCVHHCQNLIYPLQPSRPPCLDARANVTGSRKAADRVPGCKRIVCDRSPFLLISLWRWRSRSAGVAHRVFYTAGHGDPLPSPCGPVVVGRLAPFPTAMEALFKNSFARCSARRQPSNCRRVAWPHRRYRKVRPEYGRRPPFRRDQPGG